MDSDSLRPSDDSIILSDGRVLGFRSFGDTNRIPLLLFHGTPGSRLAVTEDSLIVQGPQLRVVVPDRPGYGSSDPKPDRTLLDWAHDVEELVDHLGIGAFAVAGESGGGPHALACAHALRERVTTVLLVSSPAPANFRGATRGMSWSEKSALWLSRFLPGIFRYLISSYAKLFEKDPDAFVDFLSRQMASKDKSLLAEGATREALIRELHEAYKQGSEAHATDGLLAMTGRAWGFDHREIHVPIHLWHGVEDKLVSLEMGRRLAVELPNCTAHFVSGGGHLLGLLPQVVAQMHAALSQTVGGR